MACYIHLKREDQEYSPLKGVSNGTMALVMHLSFWMRSRRAIATKLPIEGTRITHGHAWGAFIGALHGLNWCWHLDSLKGLREGFHANPRTSF